MADLPSTSDADTGIGPADASRKQPGWLAPALVVAASVTILFVMMGFLHVADGGSGWSLGFPEMLRDSTPTGGDTGAHVLLPRIIEESGLRWGWPLGWSNAWFAGFPVLYLYFPMPMLAVVLLGWVLPYGIAFKIVSAAGLVALPACTYLMVRWTGFDRLIAGVAAVTGGMFVLMESFSVFGGNVKSVILGEFSFSWSLALLAVYIGVLVRDAQIRKRIGPFPAVALALVALSHVVTVVVAVAIGLVLLLQRSRRGAIVVSWILGFGLVAFWALPFIALILQGMSPDSNWQPVTALIGSGSPLPIDLLFVVPLAVVGVVLSVRRGDRIAPILGLAVIPLVGYFVLPWLGVSAVNNGRLLPFWYFGVFVLAGIGVGQMAVAFGRRGPGRVDRGSFIAAGAAATIMVVALLGMNATPEWVESSYAGYEARPVYPEYQQLMQTVEGLPAGRIAWEYNTAIGRYGTPLALMLLPYWSPDHPSMQGLYYESSLTTPFNLLNESETSLEPSRRFPGLRYGPMDFARATRHLALFDVDYYVSFTDEAERSAREFGLETVGDAPPWTIFSLPASSPIDIAVGEPTVWAGESAFADAALEWYDDTDHLDRWLVAAGPASWVRVTSEDDRLETQFAPYDVRSAEVTNVRIEDDMIAFETTALGVPHLVKVSYFPNWSADGADGPYRAAPSLMVVVPTEHSVVLRFGNTGYDTLGLVLSAFSMVVVSAWLLRSSARRRPGAADDDHAKRPPPRDSVRQDQTAPTPRTDR